MALLFLFLSASFSSAQDFPQAKDYVNDYAHVLSAESRRKLTALCREVEEKTGAQMAVVTVQSVGDYAVAEYVNHLFEKWGLGQKGKDNGVMLFMAYKERKIRIEVGYDLEGILPDITAGRIIDRSVKPAFRDGDYDAGMLAGAGAIAQIIAQNAGVEITGTSRVRTERGRGKERSSFSLLQLLLLFLVFGGSRWLWPLLFATTFGGHGSRGGWHGGWGGGGGFGGFGGGGSGGGGAERSF